MLPLRVMSFNVHNGCQRFAIADAAKVIRDANADVVLVSESRNFAGEFTVPKIADMLGWHVSPMDLNGDSSIISKWPIEPITRDTLFLSAKVTPPDGFAPFYVISAHFFHAPYQPFQAVDLPYHDAPFIHDPEELAKAAYEARGPCVDRAIAEGLRLQALDGGSNLVFIGGDFNEPSHLDWTQAAVDAKQVPFACAFPNTLNLTRAGFTDTFRALYPDPVAVSGLTWPAFDPGYVYRADRIDFIFANGDALSLANGGPTRPDDYILEDVVISGPESPSDHYAIYTVGLWGRRVCTGVDA